MGWDGLASRLEMEDATWVGALETLRSVVREIPDLGSWAQVRGKTVFALSWDMGHRQRRQGHFVHLWCVQCAHLGVELTVNTGWRERSCMFPKFQSSSLFLCRVRSSLVQLLLQHLSHTAQQDGFLLYGFASRNMRRHFRCGTGNPTRRIGELYDLRQKYLNL